MYIVVDVYLVSRLIALRLFWLRRSRRVPHAVRGGSNSSSSHQRSNSCASLGASPLHRFRSSRRSKVRELQLPSPLSSPSRGARPAGRECFSARQGSTPDQASLLREMYSRRRRSGARSVDGGGAGREGTSPRAHGFFSAEQVALARASFSRRNDFMVVGFVTLTVFGVGGWGEGGRGRGGGHLKKGNGSQAPGFNNFPKFRYGLYLECTVS